VASLAQADVMADDAREHWAGATRAEVNAAIAYLQELEIWHKRMLAKKGKVA
jgi:hypothetical protein